MPKKKSAKATTPSQKQLQRTVSTLETEVKSAEAKSERWKKRAKHAETAVEKAEARVSKLEKKLEKQLDKSRRSALTLPAVAPETSIAPRPGEDGVAPVAGPEVSPEGGTPDDSWTVAALRAEARSRGLAGYSRKAKADLLGELTSA